jgi:hypothetical protein
VPKGGIRGKKGVVAPYAHRMHVYHVVQCAYVYYELFLHKLQDPLLTNAAIHLLLAHFTPRDLELGESLPNDWFSERTPVFSSLCSELHVVGALWSESSPSNVVYNMLR